MHGLWNCYGNVLAIFIEPDGVARTRVVIVEQFVSRAQVVGCRSQAPASVIRLSDRIRAAR